MRKRLFARYLFHPVLLVIIIGLVLGGLFMIKESSATPAWQQGTVVAFVPPPEAYPGELIAVKLVVNNAQNLAGYQGTIRYEDSNLAVAGVIPKSDLTLGGRDMMPLELTRSQGVVFLGAATCPVSDCNTSDYSATRYIQGVNGYVELATLELLANAPGAYTLVLDNIQLIDPYGASLSVAATNITINVTNH